MQDLVGQSLVISNQEKRSLCLLSLKLKDSFQVTELKRINSAGNSTAALVL